MQLMKELQSFNPIDINPAQFLPHTGSAIFVNDVLELDTSSHIVCRIIPRLYHAPVYRMSPSSYVYSTVAIEYVAQCCAVLGTISEEESKKGLLMSVRSYVATSKYLQTDVPLIVRTELAGESAYTSLFSGTVHSEVSGEKLVSCRIGIIDLTASEGVSTR